MAFRIKLEIPQRQINRLDKWTVDIDLILDSATAAVLNRNRQRYLNEQDPDGNKWPESQAAKIRRAGKYTYANGKRYTGTGTLFQSGDLFRSIAAYRKGKNARGITYDQKRYPYGEYHQRGDGQEERQFLGISAGDKTVVSKILSNLGDRLIKHG